MYLSSYSEYIIAVVYLMGCILGCLPWSMIVDRVVHWTRIAVVVVNFDFIFIYLCTFDRWLLLQSVVNDFALLFNVELSAVTIQLHLL